MIKFSNGIICFKIAIIIEMLVILSCSVLTFLEFYNAREMWKQYSLSQNKYFIWVTNKRLAPESYINDIYLTDETECKGGYAMKNLYSAKYLKGINLQEDIYNTNIYDSEQRENYTFYTFDVRSPGKENITLLYNYDFYKWRNYSFCEHKLYFNNDDLAVQLIPLGLDCNATFPEPAYDCGLYYGTYRLCILLSRLTLSNKKGLGDISVDSYSTFCPLNSIYVDASYMNSTERTDKDFTFIYKNDANFPQYKDKSFFIDLESIHIAYYYNLKDPNQTMPNSEDYNVFQIGGRNGICDLFNHDLDLYPLNKFYNDNYNNDTSKMDESQKYNINANNYLKAEDDTSYIRPIDNVAAQTPIHVYLTSYVFPPIAPDCFNNIMAKDKKFDFFRLLSEIRLSTFNEIVSYLIIWLAIKIFICLWCNLRTRFMILIDKFKLKISKDDKKSENITYLTFKALELTCFIIVSIAVIFFKYMFSNIINTTTQIINEKCFQDPITLNLISYLDFIQTLQTYNDKNVILITASGSMGILSVVTFYFGLILSKSIQFKNK
jgi:hypothetical protein